MEAHTLIEASLVPLITVSKDGKVIDLNEAMANITGLKRENIDRINFFDCFTDPAKAREAYKKVFLKGSLTVFPLTLRGSTGKLTEVLFNGTVYHDKSGKELGAVIMIRDDIARKLASHYTRSIIEAIRDPLFAIDLLGKITDVNNATLVATDITREKIKGTSFSQYFTDPAEARKAYLQIFETGYIADIPLTLEDGTEKKVICNGSVFKDDKGLVLGVVIVARDVTEQLRIESELNHAKLLAEHATGIAELATGVAEVAQQKAEAAMDVANEAMKAKQQFLSNMSHEIRTPMNAIIGFTKVLLKTNLSEKQLEYLSAIKTSGEALIVLINDILDLAKVDAGKILFEQIKFKMDLSVAAMLHLFEPRIREKNLMLIKEYDNRIPPVLIGDPVRLHQIILNLVSNAVKFTSEGAITVSVKLLSETADNVVIEFAVKDTGIGIEKEKIKTIFENFQQATSETSRIFGGTGLGLAISKKLVESQGGSIHVKSKPGKGSEFSFILKFSKTNELVEPENSALEIDNSSIKIKVLVVEDIVLNQLLMKTILDEFGFDCEIAANGKIAIEMLQSENYDIVLMDLQMPLVNGFEATDYIRNTMHCDIPIVALTADVTTVDLVKCKAVGMNDYMSKPVDERLLFNKIITLVRKPSMKQMSIGEDDEQLQKNTCINLDYLTRISKSNTAVMTEMISLYIDHTSVYIDAMKNGISNSDWTSVRAVVHKMIPTFSIVGISAEYEIMARKILELTQMSNPREEIIKLALQIETVCMQACEELSFELMNIENTNRPNEIQSKNISGR
ncbi:Sensor histidine kinase RcsC [bioreactor metagenome]|uniref:histidine kinase n=1 Tax=bioreactor metagenome TaxID=1076179 RepID=A0A644WJ33_9ZZZZ